MFAFVVGFILIFRSNFGYQRYWEGRTRIEDMGSKWMDALYEVICFDEATVNKVAIEGGGGVESGVEFRNRFIHLMSLMHALALQSLRGDVEDNSVRENLYSLDVRKYYGADGCKLTRSLQREMTDVQDSQLTSVVLNEGPNKGLQLTDVLEDTEARLQFA